MTQKLAKVAATVQGITESHTILYGRLLVAFEAYAKRSYDKSPSKDWTQKDAAKLLGILCCGSDGILWNSRKLLK